MEPTQCDEEIDEYKYDEYLKDEYEGFGDLWNGMHIDDPCLYRIHIVKWRAREHVQDVEHLDRAGAVDGVLVDVRVLLEGA